MIHRIFAKHFSVITSTSDLLEIKNPYSPTLQRFTLQLQQVKIRF